jgi:hypothetical protein
MRLDPLTQCQKDAYCRGVPAGVRKGCAAMCLRAHEFVTFLVLGAEPWTELPSARPASRGSPVPYAKIDSPLGIAVGSIVCPLRSTEHGAPGPVVPCAS